MDLVSVEIASWLAAVFFFLTTIAASIAWLHSLTEIRRMKAYDRAKTEFFSDITHELKTPVSIILGAIQLMDLKNHEYSRDLVVMKRNCYRLLKLANNLLDYAKIEAGYCALNLVICNLTDYIREIISSVQPFAEQKNIELLFETQAEEINAAVDMEKLERIMLNLLSNAIKFTNAGGKVTAGIRYDDDKVIISVRDTGIGIQKDKQGRIFERFAQVGSLTSKQNEGSGIGLSLVKSFADLHRGKIKVISEPGKGSEFIVILPKTPVKQAEKGLMRNPEHHEKSREAISIEFSDSAVN